MPQHKTKNPAADPFKAQEKTFLEAINQNQMGYDFSPTIGNPYEGFSTPVAYLKGYNSRGEGIGEIIENLGDFGNPFLGDGSLGFSFKKVVKKAVAPAKATIKVTKLVAKPTLRVTRDVKSTAVETAKKADTAATGGLVSKGVNTQLSTVGKVQYAATGSLEKVAGATPITKGLYKGIDKYSGGTLTSFKDLGQVTGRGLQGEKIPKGELIKNAVFAAKVGVAVASAGTMGPVVATTSFGAGQMKEGPVGKNKVGNIMCTGMQIGCAGYGAGATAGAAAGTAAAGESAKEAGKQAVSQEVAKQMAQEAAQKAAEEAAKQAMVDTIKNRAQQEALTIAAKKSGIKEIKQLGKVAAIAQAGDTEAMTEAAKIHTQQMVENKAKKEFSKRLAIPTSEEDIKKRITEEALKQAGLSPALAQAALSTNASIYNMKISDVPNLALSKAEREANAAKAKAEAASRLMGNMKNINSESIKLNNINTQIIKIDSSNLSADEKRIKILELSKQHEAQSNKIANMQLRSEDDFAKDSIRVAAAEEGRSIVDYRHPLLACLD